MHAQAGGKDGVVGVFGSRQLEAGQLPADASLPPLLSGKLHKGWVAEVQLLSGAGLLGAAAAAGAGDPGEAAAGLRLLTAGNDGAVCLWDLSRAAEAGGRGGLVPQCLERATSLHQGAALLPACQPQQAWQGEGPAGAGSGWWARLGSQCLLHSPQPLLMIMHPARASDSVPTILPRRRHLFAARTRRAHPDHLERRHSDNQRSQRCRRQRSQRCR